MDPRKVWFYALAGADRSGGSDRRNPVLLQILDLYARWRMSCKARIRQAFLN